MQRKETLVMHETARHNRRCEKMQICSELTWNTYTCIYMAPLQGSLDTSKKKPWLLLVTLALSEDLFGPSWGHLGTMLAPCGDRLGPF